MTKIRPVLLAILDGCGIAKPGKGNAVENANMEFVKEMQSKYPW
ncbi:phosphoglyceromutase, partial [Mycoplasma putrefaciens]